MLMYQNVIVHHILFLVECIMDHLPTIDKGRVYTLLYCVASNRKFLL